MARSFRTYAQLKPAKTAARNNTAKPAAAGRSAFQADSVTEAAVGRARRAPGSALPAAERAFFETRFQRGLGRVRIHDDTLAHRSAAQLNARAYTIGNDIVFGKDQFRPGTDAGRRLLAHELTHTIQQSRGVQRQHVQREWLLHGPGTAGHQVQHSRLEGDAQAPFFANEGFDSGPNILPEGLIAAGGWGQLQGTASRTARSRVTEVFAPSAIANMVDSFVSQPVVFEHDGQDAGGLNLEIQTFSQAHAWKRRRFGGVAAHVRVLPRVRELRNSPLGPVSQAVRLYNPPRISADASQTFNLFGSEVHNPEGHTARGFDGVAPQINDRLTIPGRPGPRRFYNVSFQALLETNATANHDLGASGTAWNEAEAAGRFILNWNSNAPRRRPRE